MFVDGVVCCGIARFSWDTHFLIIRINPKTDPAPVIGTMIAALPPIRFVAVAGQLVLKQFSSVIYGHCPVYYIIEAVCMVRAH